MPATRRPLRTFLLAAAVLAAVAAGCGDDDDDGATDGGTPGGQDAASGTCALVPSDALEGLFGSPFGEGEDNRDDVTNGAQCTWVNTDAPPVKVISVVVYSDEGLQDAFSQSAEEFFTMNRGHLVVDEELDVGDEAFRAGSVIWARDGEQLFYVTTNTGDSPEAIEGLEALARIVVDG